MKKFYIIMQWTAYIFSVFSTSGGQRSREDERQVQVIRQMTSAFAIIFTYIYVLLNQP